MKTVQRLKKTDTEQLGRGRATGKTWKDREGNEWPLFIKPEDHAPKLVKFGRGRTVIEYGKYREAGCLSSSRCECYSTPEDFFAPSRWWAHTWAEMRDVDQFEGVPFVDMREAVQTEAGYRMVMSGPMVDVDLSAGCIDRLADPSELFSGAMQGTEYGALLDLHKAQRLAGTTGALDSVDLVTWLALWREAGARVGVICGGQFVEI